MRFLAVSALALATLATPAFAQEEGPSFSGATVVILGGYDNAKIDDTDISKDGIVYGAAIGYDAEFGGFVLGGEGEITSGTTKLCAGGACLEAGRDLYAGVRAGFRAGRNILVYAKGGYSNARVEGTLPGFGTGTADLDGLRLGAGVELAGKSGFIARAEYRYSNYEADVTRNQAVLTAGFRF